MTRKRMLFLQDLLGFVGLRDRLKLEWISSSEAQKFAQVVTDFTEKIRNMGPSPLSAQNRIQGFAVPGGLFHARNSKKVA
jgi:F420-non-reducing hydrogenase iron-sulfur subunit